jgi:hypothetical protein
MGIGTGGGDSGGGSANNRVCYSVNDCTVL